MKKVWIFLLFLAVIVFVVWVIWANTALEMNTFTIQESSLPSEFDGFRIAHISDFHSANLGDAVLEMLQDAKPDVICITGDLVDCRDTDTRIVMEFITKAVEIAPCYFVTGNHEMLVSDVLYQSLLADLINAGVVLLDDCAVFLEKDGAVIALAGHFWGDTEQVGRISTFDGYRILLSHQPEALNDYASGAYELVLTGHAHGGQFRLPFVGGIYAPGQGFFPAYDSGLFSQGSTDMIVSRGIGNSTIPLRFNNRPEVILVELHCLTDD